MEAGVMSISHWGMFAVEPPAFAIPHGWRVKDFEKALSERRRPDGIIEIVRA